MKERIPKKVVIIGVIVLFLAAVTLFILFGTGILGSFRDLHRFSEMNYNGAFFSMYDISCYNEEDFATYRGILAVKAEQPVKTWRNLSRYLSKIFSTQNTITNVYLGLDPVILWEKSQRKEEKWVENLSKYLIPYFTARQDVNFEILLPTYQLDHWTGLSASQLKEELDSYSRLIDDLSGYSNVTVYFLGGEQWLIANPANYLEHGQTNEDVSRKLFLYTFCDGKYQILPENSSIMFERLTSLVEQEREAPTVYPDLSDLCMMFFGDSVLVYNAGSMSIPGVVGSLSGAQVYNYGYGGISGSESLSGFPDLNDIIGRFLTQDASGPLDNNFVQELTDYIEESHEGKRYCFVLNVGLNDYFNGLPIENPEDAYDAKTYAGALRTGIRSLKDAFPDAIILVMTPTYTTGQSIIEENVLTDYVDVAVRVAEEMGVYCKNNYFDSGIDAESLTYYLADGIHPNETGSFYLGRQIVEYIAGILSE